MNATLNKNALCDTPEVHQNNARAEAAFPFQRTEDLNRLVEHVLLTLLETFYMSDLQLDINGNVEIIYSVLLKMPVMQYEHCTSCTNQD